MLQAENIRSACCLRVVLSKLFAARKANFLSLLVVAKKSQCSHARECSQRPFVTPKLRLSAPPPRPPPLLLLSGECPLLALATRNLSLLNGKNSPVVLRSLKLDAQVLLKNAFNLSTLENFSIGNARNRLNLQLLC